MNLIRKRTIEGRGSSEQEGHGKKDLASVRTVSVRMQPVNFIIRAEEARKTADLNRQSDNSVTSIH